MTIEYPPLTEDQKAASKRDATRLEEEIAWIKEKANQDRGEADVSSYDVPLSEKQHELNTLHALMAR